MTQLSHFLTPGNDHGMSAPQTCCNWKTVFHFFLGKASCQWAMPFLPGKNPDVFFWQVRLDLTHFQSEELSIGMHLKVCTSWNCIWHWSMVSRNIPVYCLLCNRVTQPTPKLSDFWGVSLVEILLEEQSTIIILPQPQKIIDMHTKWKPWYHPQFIYMYIYIICNIHTHIYTYFVYQYIYILYIHYLLSWFFGVGFSFPKQTQMRMFEMAILTIKPFHQGLPWRLPWRTQTWRVFFVHLAAGGQTHLWPPEIDFVIFFILKKIYFKKKTYLVYIYIYLLIKTNIYLYMYV